jgi:hypothetical protein
MIECIFIEIQIDKKREFKMRRDLILISNSPILINLQ